MNRHSSLVYKLIRSIGYGLRLIRKLIVGGLRLDARDVWTPETRFVDVSCTDSSLGDSLAAEGLPYYLGLLDRTDNGRELYLDRKRSAQKCLHETDLSKGIPRNNADVMILSGQAVRHLWKLPAYQHAEYVVWSLNWSYDAAVGFLGWLNHVLRGNVELHSIVRCQIPDRRHLIVSLVRARRPNRGARRYFSPEVGIEELGRIFAAEGIRHLVLRWFDDLPRIKPGEDIDLLVHDEQIEVVEKILESRPGIIPCDVYSAGGLPGTDFLNMAYYPPALANQMLEMAIQHPSGFLVPCPEHHFLSLAFHAVYHKGSRSGIKTELDVAAEGDPEHDYTAILSQLARELGRNFEMSLENLDEQLKASGWRPSRDTLEKLAQRNLWVQKRFFASKASDAPPDLEGLAAFVLRRRAVDAGFGQEFLKLLESEGFEVIAERELAPKESDSVAERLRGGNWGRGRFPTSGGKPALLVAALDCFPKTPDVSAQAAHARLTNQRLLDVKMIARDLFNSRLDENHKCNCVHSSNNEKGALEYIDIMMPMKMGEIRDQAQQMVQNVKSVHVVRRRLPGHGRRAKVEVIEYGQGLAVKKTYRQSCVRYLDRELFIMRKYGSEIPEIPKLLEAGPNYFICPYYEDILDFDPQSRRLLPLPVVRQAVAFLRFLYNEGYSLIDFTPQNLLVDRNSGLKIIDHEFLHKYSDKPEKFAQCYELAGVPDDCTADRPKGSYVRAPYENQWRWRVGLTLDSLLHDPVWTQHVKRLAFRLRAALPFNAGKVYRSMASIWRG